MFPKSRQLELTAADLKAYAKQFARVNGEVKELTGVDLAAFGYVTPSNLEAFLRDLKS